eukprot:2990936-Rhodomonas_salina.1
MQCIQPFTSLLPPHPKSYACALANLALDTYRPPFTVPKSPFRVQNTASAIVRALAWALPGSGIRYVSTGHRVADE